MRASVEATRARVFFERGLRALGLCSGMVLAAIMLLVSVSVFFRYLLNRPILGDQELVEIGMSLVVMLAMPLVTLRGQHIRVDVFDRRLGETGRYLGDLFARAVSVVVLALLLRQTWGKSLDAHEYGDVTNMIEIPVWIAYGAITLGMALYVCVLLLQLADQWRHGRRDYE